MTERYLCALEDEFIKVYEDKGGWNEVAYVDIAALGADPVETPARLAVYDTASGKQLGRMELDANGVNRVYTGKRLHGVAEHLGILFPWTRFRI